MGGWFRVQRVQSCAIWSELGSTAEESIAPPLGCLHHCRRTYGELDALYVDSQEGGVALNLGQHGTVRVVCSSGRGPRSGMELGEI